jgi:NADH dehydrogenase
VGFKNRLTAVLHWFVSFIGRGRSERTVTLQQVIARTALEEIDGSVRAAAATTGDRQVR